MSRKLIIPLLALAGLIVALLAILRGDRTPPINAPVIQAPQSPYTDSVAGSGLIEASTENISVGTPVSGIVTGVFVKAGSAVKNGDPLFALDDRPARAEQAARQAAAQVAEAQLAGVRQELDRTVSLVKLGLASQGEIESRRLAAQTAEAQLALAQSEMETGTIHLEQLTVRAPVAGQVLQCKVHPGEFVAAAATGKGLPFILLGSITPLQVRVNIDENDAWRVHAGAPATGFLRGNRNVKIPLKFIRFEPYVIPRTSLTGGSTERVDARVLQVIYDFERGDLPLFAGQQMDVFINTLTEHEKETP